VVFIWRYSVMILASHGLIASQIASFDADASAFFGRVATAGGTLSTTEKQAVNQLVLDLKANSLWTPMKAIYPMVGASAAACAQNLKSSSFTGTFTSGWTFASTGVTGNGTSAFFDTNFNPTTSNSINNFSLSVYLRTGTTIGGYVSDYGNAVGPVFLPLTVIESTPTGRANYCWDFTTGAGTVATTDSRGMWGASRSGVNSWVSFERNTAVAKTTATTQSTLPNSNIYGGAINDRGTAINFSTRQIAMAHCGDSLTTTQYNNFYTAVQTFQTTLSRQV
jgi:hypothetical protein